MIMIDKLLRLVDRISKTKVHTITIVSMGHNNIILDKATHRILVADLVMYATGILLANLLCLIEDLQQIPLSMDQGHKVKTWVLFVFLWMSRAYQSYLL